MGEIVLGMSLALVALGAILCAVGMATFLLASSRRRAALPDSLDPELRWKAISRMDEDARTLPVLIALAISAVATFLFTIGLLVLTSASSSPDGLLGLPVVVGATAFAAAYRYLR